MKKGTTRKINKPIVIGISLGVILLMTFMAIFEFDRTPNQNDDISPRSTLTSQVNASAATWIPLSQTASVIPYKEIPAAHNISPSAIIPAVTKKFTSDP